MLTLPRPSRLREAHCHLPMLGRALSMIDVSMCRSLDEMLHALRVCTHNAEGLITDNSSTFRADESRQWVIAIGMRIESWSDARWPTRQDLDRVFPDRPCIVRSFDFHSLVANSAALGAAGVHRGTPDPSSGVFKRDEMGELTGVALESAESLIWKSVPEPSATERTQHLRAALAHLRSLGFVEAHDLKSPAWLGPELARMADAGELDMHIELYPMVEEAGQTMKSRQSWERDHVRLGGFKLFADGTLNSRTAWMLHPYVDGMAEHPRGLPNWTPEQITEAVRIAERCGVALATHAIGDAAVRAVLNAIEAVKSERIAPDIHHRIEHCEVVDPREVPRFAALGAIASVQPCHLIYDIPVLTRALPDRLEHVLPLRDMMMAGCKPGELLWFGSDAPIVPADPIASIAAAVGRGELGLNDGVAAESLSIAAAQALTEENSWKAFVSRH
ncbi:MAG: amidohydrolase [Planctomycetes bacterium]|nr:amidohydrolase [Planctomycetota bacterium]